MEINVIGSMGSHKGTINISEKYFSREYNAALVHQIVIACQANARTGTRAQKTRAEVSHSTRKPWRQKGTGRARSGMRSSPIWRGGGVSFPSKPTENFSHKVNKSMFKAGMSCIYSRLIREGRLIVIDELKVAEFRTKHGLELMKDLNLGKDVLMITKDFDRNLYISVRNIANAAVIKLSQVNPLCLLSFKIVAISKQALLYLDERVAC